VRKKGSALGIEPLEITVDPVDIHIRLENKISRSVSISPSFRGSIAEGFEMTSQLAIPASVTAEGPRSIIEALREINTGTIDLGGRYENFSVMINIINNDPFIVIYGNKMVEYRGTIRQIARDLQIDNEADEADDL
jgi:YbbR domain-containing protein